MGSCGASCADQLDVLAYEAVEHLVETGHEPVEVEQLRRDNLPAAEGQQLLREGRGAGAGTVDLFYRGARRVVGPHGFEKHLRVAADHREEIVEIVRHAPSQPAHGFHLLGLAELLLQTLAIGHVGDHGDAADHVALGIQLRRVPERHVDECAVFAPALPLDAGDGLGTLQAVEVAAEEGLILFRHDGEGLAEDLLLEPSEHALGGAVPAPHAAAKVHGDDGQRAGLDDHPEHVVGAAQFVFGMPAGGQVRAGSDDELDTAVRRNQRGVRPGDQAAAAVARNPVVLHLVWKAPRPQVLKRGFGGGHLFGRQRGLPKQAAAYLFQRAAGSFLAGAIEAQNAPVPVEHEHQAGYGVHHGRGPVPLAAKGLLIAFGLADIAKHDHSALEAAGLVPQGHG